MQAAQTALKPRRDTRDGVRVLVADPDELIRTTLAQLLRRAGYTVGTAATTDEALLAAREANWDCLVVDLDLPEAGGLALYSQLHLQGRAYFPAVFLATWPTAILELGLRRAGWVRLLRKPCAFTDLLAALERCLGAPRTP